MKNVRYEFKYGVGDIVYYPILATDSKVIKSKVEEIHIRKFANNTIGTEYILSAVDNIPVLRNYASVTDENALYDNYADANEYLQNILNNL
jgi:hypothetical protein